MTGPCPDEKMNDLVQAMQSQESGATAQIEQLIAQYPEDARLYFLHGSNMAGAGRLIEAHDALQRAVKLAPDFAIARFQLGFFLLTSGEADNALEVWGRLDRLPNSHYLRKFVDGLRCLIRDDFEGAVTSLREGMVLNDENPPLNRDMQLIIDQCTPLASAEANDTSDATSETAMILRQFSRTPKPD